MVSFTCILLYIEGLVVPGNAVETLLHTLAVLSRDPEIR